MSSDSGPGASVDAGEGHGRSGGRGIGFGVRERLLLAFGLFALAVFGVGGFLTYERMRRAVEEELGQKLLTVGRLVAEEITEDQRRMLVAGGARTSSSVSRQLGRALETAGLYRLFIFDDLGRSLADADGREPGATYPELEFEREAVAGVFAGQPVVSHLFTGLDGRIHKAAYVPLPTTGELKASLAVVGRATFLDAIQEVRNGMLVASLVGLSISVLIALLMASSIVHPIRRLVASADRIRAGDLETHVADVGSDEIGYLGQTLERMRDSVLVRDRSLRTMLGGVAHEIRNPLGGIQLFAGLLRRRVEGDEKSEQSADRILHEVSHLDDIIKDFLEYARPTEPTRQPVSVASLVDEVRGVVSGLLDERQVKLAAEGDATIEVDPAQCRRVLINLVMNAAQAIEGGGQVVIRTTDAAERVVVDVIDDGPGIPETSRGLVFDPFYTTREQGSGLGLTIARDLVARNDGTLEILSSGNEGTIIRMSWAGAGGSS